LDRGKVMSARPTWHSDATQWRMGGRARGAQS
jgi:hypothetical protein